MIRLSFQDAADHDPSMQELQEKSRAEPLAATTD